MLGEHVLALPARIDSSQTVELELLIDTEKCREPIASTRRIHLRGVYVAEFEGLVFTPCRDNQGVLEATWGRRKLQRAWIEFAASTRLVTPKWPRGSGDEYRGRWYMEVSGILTGPGQYGHLGVSPYDLKVDTVFVIKNRPPRECGLSLKKLG
jgi:hypothetical protein